MPDDTDTDEPQPDDLDGVTQTPLVANQPPTPDAPADGPAEALEPDGDSVVSLRVAANRRNAARSTGPRTPAGKAASSQNAVRHGGYARQPITRGPFREDPDEVQAEAAAIIDALDPQDALQDTEAALIAGYFRGLRRVGVLEGEAVASRSDAYDSTRDPETGRYPDEVCGSVAASALRATLLDSSMIQSRLGRELDRALQRYAMLSMR